MSLSFPSADSTRGVFIRPMPLAPDAHVPDAEPEITVAITPSPSRAGEGGTGASSWKATSAPAAGTEPAVLPLRRILRRFSHLLILTSLFAVPLMYPLQIPEGLDYRITQWSIGKPVAQYLWVEQFQSAFFSGYSPLTLKRVVWAILTLALACSHLLWKLLPDRPRETSSGRRFTIENIAILGFVAWSGLSLNLWLPRGEGSADAWGGFLYSLDAWSELVIGVAFFFLTADLLRRRRWVFKGIGLLLGSAAIVAVLAVGQRQGWTWAFLTRWAPEEIRNRMSSLIGQNTGLASFLMAPTLLSLALGLPRWRQLGRPAAALLGFFWLLMILTVIMAQSRAVILILLIAIPIMLWKLHRSSGLSPGRRAWTVLGSVVLLVGLSQVIPGDWNPFYDKVLPLTRRVHDLGLERLKAETRTRVLACSGSLVAEAPLQGHGFGSFQYVYPKAQGEYFQKHPDTFLVPTPKRSQHAHNEYLQTLIETGIVGLLLALISLGFIIRKGWRAYSHTLRPDDIPIQIALLTGIVCILAQAFVDFPFRVPPITITLVWLLAVWQAGGKIWLPRQGRHIWPEDEDTAPGGDTSAHESVSRNETPVVATPIGEEGAVESGGIRGKGRWIVWWVFAGVVVGAMIVASSWYSRNLVADVLTTRANHYFDTYMSTKGQAQAMQRANLLKGTRDLARRSLRLRPVDGDTLLLRGFAEYYLGRESLLQAKSAEKAGAAREKAFWESDARSNAQASLLSLRLALSEIRYHQVFHIQAEDYHLLGELTGNREYLEKARENLETTIGYSTAYAEGIISLVRLIESSFPELRERRNALLSLLFHYNPDSFLLYFVVQGDKAVEDERYHDAIEIFRDLSDAVPEDVMLLGRLASTYLDVNDLEKCEAVMTEMSQVEPRPLLYDILSASVAMRRGQWKRALAHLNQVLESPGGDLDYFRVMKYSVLEKLNETEAARQGIHALERKAKRNPQVYIDFANALINQFNDTEKGVAYIRRFIRESDLPVPPRLLFVLARHEYTKEGKTTEAIRLLRQALRLQPDHKPSRDLLIQILRKQEESGGAKSEPAIPAVEPTAAPPSVP